MQRAAACGLKQGSGHSHTGNPEQSNPHRHPGRPEVPWVEGGHNIPLLTPMAHFTMDTGQVTFRRKRGSTSLSLVLPVGTTYLFW